jgi:hypothetical protein
MEKPQACAVCGTAVVQADVGRPRRYGSGRCRRVREYRLRRVQSQLAEAEKRQMRARAELHSCLGTYGSNRLRLELEAWSTEVERLMDELVELLDDDPADGAQRSRA